MPPDIQLYNQEVDLRSQMLISLINGHNPVLDDKSGGMDGPCGRIAPVVTNAEEKIAISFDPPAEEFTLAQGRNRPEWRC